MFLSCTVTTKTAPASASWLCTLLLLLMTWRRIRQFPETVSDPCLVSGSLISSTSDKCLEAAEHTGHVSVTAQLKFSSSSSILIDTYVLIKANRVPVSRCMRHFNAYQHFLKWPAKNVKLTILQSKLFSPWKLEAAPSAEQVLLFCGGTERLHCAAWVSTVYHNGNDMHFLRFRDFFHSKFFLTLGNTRLFQVIDNRSFQGIESAPVQVNGKNTYWLKWHRVSLFSFIIFFWD